LAGKGPGLEAEWDTPRLFAVREAPATETAGNLCLTVASTFWVAQPDGVDGINGASVPSLQLQALSSLSFFSPQEIRWAVFDAFRHLGVIA